MATNNYHNRRWNHITNIICRALLILLLIVLSGCTGSSTTGTKPATNANAQGKIVVAASISIIADMVKNVGGDRIDVQTIVPVNADPHTFDPTPNDVKLLSQAQGAFINGNGLENWFDKIIQNVGNKGPVIVVSQGITPISETGNPQENDPHMWFDVTLANKYVENIRDGLIKIDPAGTATYQANAETYTSQLRETDAWVSAQIATIPATQRKLVTSHDTFEYYARRYGLEIVGTVFESASPDQEPSPQQIAQLVKQIKALNVKAVFTENTVNPKLAQQIAQEAGVKVITSLYTDSLGPPGSEADTYIKLIKYDTTTITNALK